MQCSKILSETRRPEVFYIYYIAFHRGSLPKFRLCPWGQKWSHLQSHQFTLNFIGKSLNNIFF